MISVMEPSGLVLYEPKHGITFRLDRKETEMVMKHPVRWEMFDWHPELVHINITDRCNKDCKNCYVKKGDNFMSLYDFKKIVDLCVVNKVFSITLGGGEPFLHNEIDAVVDYATRAINVGVTTNGTVELRYETIRKFRQVNVSYHGNWTDVGGYLKYLRETGVQRGINFVYDMTTQYELEYLIEVARDYDAEILFLQMKPITDDEWRNYICPEETYKKAKILVDKYRLKVAVDGAACYRCMQKQRFMTIGINGDVYPCSFIHEPKMGNLLFDDFFAVWKNRGKQIVCPYMKEEDQKKLEDNSNNDNVMKEVI